MNRGVLHGWLGQIEAAEADTQRALDMFLALGWNKRAADMQHNLAWLAGRRGDIVDALRRFDLAEADLRAGRVPAVSHLSGPMRDAARRRAGRRSARHCRTLGSEPRCGGRPRRPRRGVCSWSRGRRFWPAKPTARRRRCGGGVVVVRPSAPRRVVVGCGSLAIESRLLSGRVELADVDRGARYLGDRGRRGAPRGRHRRATARRRHRGRIRRLGREWSSRSALDRGHPWVSWRDSASSTCAPKCSQLAANATRPAPHASMHSTTFADVAAALGGTEMRASVAIHANRLASLGLKLALDEGDPETVSSGRNAIAASALAPATGAAAGRPRARARAERTANGVDGLDESASCRPARSRLPRVESPMAQERVRRRVLRCRAGSAHRRRHSGARCATSSTADAAWAMFLQSEGRQYVIYVARDDVELVDLGDGAGHRARCGQRERQRVAAPACDGRAASSAIPRRSCDAAARLDELLFAGFDRSWDRVVVCPVGTGIQPAVGFACRRCANGSSC